MSGSGNSTSSYSSAVEVIASDTAAPLTSSVKCLLRSMGAKDADFAADEAFNMDWEVSADRAMFDEAAMEDYPVDTIFPGTHPSDKEFVMVDGPLLQDKAYNSGGPNADDGDDGLSYGGTTAAPKEGQSFSYGWDTFSRELEVRYERMESQRKKSELLMERSKNHFRRSHIVVHFLAQGSNGAAFLALKNTKLIEILKQFREHGDVGRACALIRMHLLVAKFFLPLDAEGDLTNEIRFLGKVLPPTEPPCPRITQLGESHIDGVEQWLTMPYVAGGTLRHLVGSHAQDCVPSFIWHLGRDLALAILYLHYGITDATNMVPLRHWPFTFFGDMHAGNMLIQPSKPASSPLLAQAKSIGKPAGIQDTCGNYPNLVLADFGRATEYAKKNLLGAAQAHQDIQEIGTILASTLVASKLGNVCKEHNRGDGEAGSPDCLDCVKIALRYERLPKLKETEKLILEWKETFFIFHGKGNRPTREELFELLTRFVSVATTERDKNYVPVSSSLVESVKTRAVTDEQLEAAVLAI